MGSNWMSNLSDGTPISQLSIPGTHDSHSTRENMNVVQGFKVFGRLAETQDTGIYAQLMNGVRFLDLRVGEGKRMRHGQYTLRGELGDCLNEVQYFLDRNRTETVLVMVKWDQDVPEPDWFTKHVGELWFAHQWESRSDWPNLGDIRGRALLLRRFNKHPESPQLGIDVTEFFEQDRSRTSCGKWDSKPRGNESGGTYTEKWDMVQQHLQKAMAGAKDDGVVYFTNLAGVYLFEGVVQRMPADYAEELNPKMVNYMKSLQGKQRLGVVQMDFINEEASRVIYQKNF